VGLLFSRVFTPSEHSGSDSESIGRVFIILSLFSVAVEQDWWKSWRVWLLRHVRSDASGVGPGLALRNVIF
jgi:hypothetical protein